MSEKKVNKFKFPKLNKLNYDAWLVPLSVCFFVGLIVHFSLYSNGLMTPDGLWRGEYGFGAHWQIQLGRWGLYIVELTRGGIHSQVLCAVLAILYSSIAGIMIAKIFYVTNKYVMALIAISITCSPMVAMFITYPFSADAYALSLLLAALAVYCVTTMKPKIIGIVASISCITFCIGLYQSSIGMVLAIAIGYIIISLLREPEKLSVILKNSLWVLLALFISTVLYYVITVITQFAWNVPMADYKGASNFGIYNIISHLPNSLYHALRDFTRFFTGTTIARNAFNERTFYLLILAITVTKLVFNFMEMKKKPATIITIIVLLVMLPFASNIICILTPDAGMYLLMVSGMMVMVPLMLGIINVKGNLGLDSKLGNMQKNLKLGVKVIVTLLIWSYVLSNQTDAIVMNIGKNQTLSYAEWMWSEIREHDDYIHGKTMILIAGVPWEYEAPNESTASAKANSYALWGLVWGDYNGSVYTWSEVYRQYLGITYVICPTELFKEIVETDEFARMPYFPEEGSIQMIRNVLVVKFSDTTYWEK